MLGYIIVILICSVNVDHSDCQRETAIDVIRGPRVENAIMCTMGGQTMVARTALAHGDGREYLKILCIPSDHEGKTVSGVAAPEDE